MEPLQTHRCPLQPLPPFLTTLSESKDVVLLQEVWLAEDARLLMHSAGKAGLVHAMHFKSGKFGSGLVSLSRFPITDSGFWRYSAAGDAFALGCGDFYAGKGGGMGIPAGLGRDMARRDNQKEVRSCMMYTWGVLDERQEDPSKTSNRQVGPEGNDQGSIATAIVITHGITASHL